MPTPPLTDELCLEALQAFNDAENKSEAARSLGLHRMTYINRLRTAHERGLHLSEGIRGAVATAALRPGEAKAGWIVDVDPDTGSRKSTYWRAPEPEPTDYAEDLRSVFEGIEPAKKVDVPKSSLPDLLTLYPLMDVHFGMQAWGRETGDADYSLAHATADMSYAFQKVQAITPNSEKAILIIGGDFFHQDDNRAETPQSKHKLDTDTRHWKIMDQGVQLLADVIQRLLEKHQDVHVRVLRGNHDEHAHLVLTFALTERYRLEPRVTVEKNPRDLFMFQWGKCAIFSHHGDKAKPQQMALYLSDVCEFWSETRHRFCLTGHVHHDQAKDVGPLRWESLRAFCPPDAYAASMGYGARRALQSLTFDKQDGLVLRAMDPIER